MAQVDKAEIVAEVRRYIRVLESKILSEVSVPLDGIWLQAELDRQCVRLASLGEEC